MTQLLKVSLSDLVKPDLLCQASCNVWLLLHFPIRLNLLVDDIFSALLCQDSTLIVLSKVANLIVAVVAKSLQDHFLHFNPEVVHQQHSRQLKEALLHFWFDLNHLSIQLYPIHEVNHHVQFSTSAFFYNIYLA